MIGIATPLQLKIAPVVWAHILRSNRPGSAKGIAGINAVAKGQWEAADAIGMTRWQVYRYIVLPQSVRFMLPPMTGEVVNMIKSSAIVSVIAVAELTTIGRNIISDTYMSFEIWFTIAAVYMVVTLIISTCATLLEKRYAVRD